MLKINGPISYIFVGLFIAGFFYSIFLNFRTYSDNWFPHAPIFTADVMVPDFQVGTHAVLLYNRIIEQPFRGLYYVEVKNALTGENVCKGNGTGFYTPDDVLIPPIYFDWYVNNNCIEDVPVGQYFVETTYVIQLEDKPNKFYTTTSNIFNITP